MKRLPLLLAALLLVGNTFAQESAARTDALRITLHFAVDDHRLNDAAQAELDRYIATLDLNTEYEMMVQGHTDSDGRLSYNEVLARERTRTVKERLIAAGVDPGRIASRSFGERSPVADNEGAEQKQMNRRVEVVYTHHLLGGLDDLHKRIAGERTTHRTIDPNTENWLRGTNGAVVRVPAKALRNANGDVVNGPVDIAITEALGLEAIIAEGLSTRSGNGMLETGGMLRIEASASDGGSLALDPASPLLVSIPAAMRQEGMSLFISTDGTDWSNTGQEPLDLRKWDLPRRPVHPWPEFKAPVYKPDLSARPPLPMEPARPIQPQPPRKESYSTHVAWYQFLQKDRIAAADQRRFDAAMMNYDERMAKYEAKMEAYKEGCRTWPQRYAA